MSAEIIELDVITKLDLDASEILSEIAKEDPKHVFLVVWPKDGGHPTFHASTSDTPVVLYQLESEAHMLTPAPLPKQDPADAPYHFCALASLCDDGPRAPEEG
jgi:hypothetical protein